MFRPEFAAEAAFDPNNMKACPQCGHQNDDDSGFCVIDGAPLDGSRVVVSLEEPEPEMPTQWVPRPQPPPAAPPQKVPGFVYALIGGLGAAVVLLGGFVLFLALSDRWSKTETEDGNKQPSGNAAVVTSNMPNLGGVPKNSTNASSLPPAPQGNANAPVEVGPPGNSSFMPNGPDTARTFDRLYAGTVGDNGVSMQLRRQRDHISGRIIPNGRYADIFVEGSVDRDGTFTMDETSDIGEITGVYRGRLNSDGTISGSWSKPDGSRTRPMFLRRK